MRLSAWTNYYGHHEPIRAEFEVQRHRDGLILRGALGRRDFGVSVPKRHRRTIQVTHTVRLNGDAIAHTIRRPR